MRKCVGCGKQKKCCQSSDMQEQDYLVCTCMGVMNSEIIEAIDRGIDTFDKLSEELDVGTGCSSCIDEIHQILEKKKD